MPFITWSDDYSIGVEIFDAEHKNLIGIINDLHDGFLRGLNTAGLEEICNRLVEYTMLHFRHEEMYFEDWAYPDKDKHGKSHEELRAQVFRFRDQLLARSSADLATDLWDFLARWLLEHVQSEDRQYGEFLRRKGLC